jgi:hypothetical protein
MSNVNPVIGDRLSDAANRLLNKTLWYWTTRLRSAVDDAAYVAVILLIYIGITEFRIFIDDSLKFSLADRFRAAGSGLGDWIIVTLIDILILTFALRIAPRQGVFRWVAMILGVSTTMLLGNRYFVVVAGAHPGFDHVAQSAITTILIATACFFHNTARDVESDLFRTQIDIAGREAAFNRAQLELLRAQIEPHFLFNTLATVRALAQVDRRSAADMIDNLLRYFAAALPRLRQNESTLADEIDLIDAYLRIQQVRLGARLSYGFFVPERLLTARVPPVMLLTLVENAIKHGIGPATAGGTIHVSADSQGSLLTLRVADTGAGMRAEQGHGSGLANVRSRLKLLYRHRATLSLAPGEPRGVVATIQIPMGQAA